MASGRLPSRMKAWQILQFGKNEVLQINENAKLPIIKRSDQLIAKVTAASINPIDIRMRQGYSGKLIERMAGKESMWPLTLGRDFSGEVVDIGRSVRRVKIGDKIWGTCLPFGTGSHAEYTVASQQEVALKPNFLSHVEAASMAYAAITAWAALSGRAGMNRLKARGKKFLVLGGSGGVGTFSIQLIKAWGGRVVTTCGADAMTLVKSLGANMAIDYRSNAAWNDIEREGKFDVIFDLNGEDEDKALPLVAKRGTYVTLNIPMMEMIDDLGPYKGTFRATIALFRKSFRQSWKYRSSYKWAFAVGSGSSLEKLTPFIEQRNIKPIIERVLPFSEVDKAYATFETGHARGKTVIDFTRR